MDLPGYGYANANEKVKAQWGKMIEDYLHKSKQLKLVFLLIDIRHEPSGNDRIMYDWVVRMGYHPVIIATKADKIKRSQLQKQLKLIRTTLQVEPETVMIPFSAQTKQGREEIYELLDTMLAGPEPIDEEPATVAETSENGEPVKVGKISETGKSVKVAEISETGKTVKEGDAHA